MKRNIIILHSYIDGFKSGFGNLNNLNDTLEKKLKSFIKGKLKNKAKELKINNQQFHFILKKELLI